MVFDGILVALVVLAVVANIIHVQAKPETHPAAWGVPIAEEFAAENDNPANDIPASERSMPDISGTDRSDIDNNTLAGMIAAENAALIIPIYLLNLPIISK
jgi:hypothetical protein